VDVASQPLVLLSLACEIGRKFGILPPRAHGLEQAAIAEERVHDQYERHEAQYDV
jgi:hypothetical protein